jgi:antitoxin component YwqK of YwqJK toxin-antitoxin module
MARIYKDGELVSYSYPASDGKLVPFIPIKNGTGKAVTYYKNGQMARVVNFLSGEVDSTYFIYHPNGKLAEENIFEYGVQQGSSKEYYPDGTLKVLSNYVNYELTGEYIENYPSGSVKEKGIYKNGKKNGIFEYYDTEGKLIKRIIYYNNDVCKAEYF